VGRLHRDSWQQDGAGTPVEALEPGDLVTYGGDRLEHIAFWLVEGRILHATARGGLGATEESEAVELRARRRRVVRM
jgi:cell wall-associated NlpC family hydrolase